MVGARVVGVYFVTSLVEVWLLLDVANGTFEGDGFGAGGRRKCVVDVQILTEANDEDALTILRNAVVGGIEQFPLHVVASFVEAVEEHDEYVLEYGVKQSLYVLNHEELRLLRLNHVDVFEEQLTALILQPFLLAGNAPRLARRSTDEAITIGYRSRINLADVAQHKLCVEMVAKVSGTTMRLELICPNHIEARLLKAKIKTSTTCKE